MAKSKLTPRQRAVRRILVERKGLVSVREICDEVGCGRTAVWLDKQAIQQHRPIPEDDPGIKQEIEKAINWFQVTEAHLLGELADNEAQEEKHRGEGRGLGLLQVRCSYLKQIRENRQNWIDFLFRVGYLKEVPKKFELSTPISNLTTPEHLDAEIVNIDQQIRALEGAPGGRTTRTEAEEADLQAEADDRLQGAGS